MLCYLYFWFWIFSGIADASANYEYPTPKDILKSIGAYLLIGVGLYFSTYILGFLQQWIVG